MIIQKEMNNNHLTHLGINLSHYELEEDVVFCATCVSQEKKGNLKHCQKSRMYIFLEAASMLVIWEIHEDVGEVLSNTLSQEKLENRQVLLKILENVRFLNRQGLPFRRNDKEGNFYQMLLNFSKTDDRITD